MENVGLHILLCILTPTLVRGINSRRVIYYPRTTYSLRINRVIILALTVDSHANATAMIVVQY